MIIKFIFLFFNILHRANRYRYSFLHNKNDSKKDDDDEITII